MDKIFLLEHLPVTLFHNFPILVSCGSNFFVCILRYILHFCRGTKNFKVCILSAINHSFFTKWFLKAWTADKGYCQVFYLHIYLFKRLFWYYIEIGLNDIAFFQSSVFRKLLFESFEFFGKFCQHIEPWSEWNMHVGYTLLCTYQLNLNHLH